MVYLEIIGSDYFLDMIQHADEYRLQGVVMGDVSQAREAMAVGSEVVFEPVIENLTNLPRRILLWSMRLLRTTLCHEQVFFEDDSVCRVGLEIANDCH